MKWYFLYAILISSVNGSETGKKEFVFNEELYSDSGIRADYNSGNVIQRDGELILALTQDTGGTRITVADNIRYGTIEANLRVSSGSNVVTSFILMAENGDEIDFEFVGKDDNVIQTNYFYKGIPIYDKNAKFYAANKRLSESFNTYTINWTPEYYQWKFNHIVLRTLDRNGTASFPDSPSAVQLGIWKANPSGWAGWGVDWSKGPFNLTIKSISIESKTILDTSPPLEKNHTSNAVFSRALCSSVPGLEMQVGEYQILTDEITKVSSDVGLILMPHVRVYLSKYVYCPTLIIMAIGLVML